MTIDRKFVKAATTTTNVAKSKTDMEKLARRYGAEGYAVSHDYVSGKAVIQFLVPDSGKKGAEMVQVRIPINLNVVFVALYGTAWMDPARRRRRLEQAERVAWRNLYLWVDAQMSAATVGLQTMTEAFYAHAAIGPNGERAIDYVQTLMDSSRLLTSGDPE